MGALTITVRSGLGTPKQVKDLQNILIEKYNVGGIYDSEGSENCKWILTGSLDNLRKVMKELFNVWNGPCPMLPNELLNEEDIKKLGY